MIYIVFEIERTVWSNIKHMKMTSLLGTVVSQGNDVYPWTSCATLYMVMEHGQSVSFIVLELKSNL